MRVLLTGGQGFLGRRVAARLLARGVDVRVFDLPHGDIADSDAVRAALADCEGVVHLAGILTPDCQRDPVLGARVNLLGSLNVFSACRDLGIRHIAYASSAGVFGADDATSPHPGTHYGAFKLAVEGCARAFLHDAGLPSIGLRPFIVYGPERETGNSAGVSLACKATAQGRDYVIPFSGAAGFVYVDDVAAAFEAAVLTDNDGAHVYNCVGTVADTRDVVSMIRELCPGARIGNDGPTLGIATNASEAGLERLLPPQSRTSLRDGLAATIAYYAQKESSDVE